MYSAISIDSIYHGLAAAQSAIRECNRDDKSMKFLVTGSAGHLGEALVRTLRGLNHEVVGLARIIREAPACVVLYDSFGENVLASVL